MTEAIGYVASGLILLSFMMKGMRRLRWVNIIGCAVFIVYGSLLGSIPIIITNASILLVNVYYLYVRKQDSEKASD